MVDRMSNYCIEMIHGSKIIIFLIIPIIYEEEQRNKNKETNRNLIEKLVSVTALKFFSMIENKETITEKQRNHSKNLYFHKLKLELIG